MVNPQDQEAFDRIVNVPKRKIGDVGKEKITQYRQDNQCSFIDVCLQSTEISGMNKQSVFNLQQLGKVLSELRDSIDNYPPTEIVKILIESVRYFEDYLVPEYGSHEAEDRFENIQELVNAIHIFEQDNPDSSIADFLREASLLSTVDEDEENQDNFVSLMTIHSSKGLEFPIVFVIGLSEGVLPSYNERDGITDEKLDEEKRLLYVAITRAMNQLYLSYEEMSFRYGLQKENEKSQFLDSIPVELLNETKTEKNYAMQRDSGTKNYGSYRFGNKSNSSKKTSPTMSPKQHTSGMQEALAIEQPTNHKTVPVDSIADLQEGTKVVHTMFGVGKVEYLSAAMAKVSFSKFGTQVMMGSAIKNLKKIVE